jgi:CDP-glycerol glycerophosphotransferase (TagB/SpsB family)
VVKVNKRIAHLSGRRQRLIKTLISPLKLLSVLIDLFYPKNDKTVILGSNTGEFASGSPQALFDYLRTHHPEWQVYYYLPYKEASGLGSLIKYVFKFAPLFFKAKFLVTSHPPSDFYPFDWSRRKVLINTWHGIPLKAMFFAARDDHESDLKNILRLDKKISAFLVSSRLEAAMLTKCFLIDPRKFYYLGQPKNDNLFNRVIDPRVLPAIPDLAPDSKLVLYCPTYRSEETRFFPFKEFDIKALNRFLEDHNTTILVRGHVYEKSSYSRFLSDRIIDFGFSQCNDINAVLPQIDALITDYSSIYIDYMLMDRPLIFVPYDLAEYEKSRGLLFNDYQFWTPGYQVLTYPEFIQALTEIISGQDVHKTRRAEINRQLNYYQAGDSSRKVVELMQNWSKYNNRVRHLNQFE